MNIGRIRTLAGAALLVMGAGLLAFGCSSKSAGGSLIPNQSPTVTLTSAPIDTTQEYFYVVRLNWLGFDQDGRIDFYEYALLDGVATPDTIRTWRRTAKTDSTFFFQSRTPKDYTPGARLIDRHTFVLRAVDDDGARSPMIWRTFFSYTIAPSVRIVGPQPSELLINKVPPSVFMTWLGDDYDGEFTKKPVKYKFRLFSANDPTIQPDDPTSFNQFAPGFAGWDSVGGDTTFKLYTELVPQQDYVFVITGFDEAGAYDPAFSRNTNVLRFRVTLSGTLGPVITIFNEFITWTYGSGGYSTSSDRIVRVEVPANQAIRWNWFATPPEGALTRRTRWKLDDVVELGDERPRTNELTDLYHWSQWQSLGQVPDDAFSVALPAFPGPVCGSGQQESHTLYMEVEDNINLRSLGILEFQVVRPCFDKPLLIVDDVRGPPDQFRGAAPNLIVNPPIGSWPMETELDTFFYAIGGVPWRGFSNTNCPPGWSNCPTTQLNSPPGIFKGYPFDTVDTRRGLIDLTFPLSELAHYERVIWYTDPLSAAAPISNGPLHPVYPLTSLIWMNSPNRPNSLATYSRQGGDLMFFGGAIVMGCIYGWTNPTLGFIWKADGPRPALTPGRFVYDILKMQTEVTSLAGTQVRRSVPLPPRQPLLPALVDMTLKRGNPAEMPPYRSTGFLSQTTTIEHVTQPLSILEDADPGPGFNEVSIMDTLFTAFGGAIDTGTPTNPKRPPCGFYIHPVDPAVGTVILLGFDMWSWRQAQIQTNMDVMLQGLWGLQKTPAPSRPRIAAARN
jgi:hypothetical protein